MMMCVIYLSLPLSLLSIVPIDPSIHQSIDRARYCSLAQRAPAASRSFVRSFVVVIIRLLPSPTRLSHEQTPTSCCGRRWRRLVASRSEFGRLARARSSARGAAAMLRVVGARIDRGLDGLPAADARHVSQPTRGPDVVATIGLVAATVQHLVCTHCSIQRVIEPTNE